MIHFQKQSNNMLVTYWSVDFTLIFQYFIGRQKLAANSAISSGSGSMPTPLWWCVV